MIIEKSLRKKIPYRTFIKLFFMFLTIPLSFAWVDSAGMFGKPQFVPESLTEPVSWFATLVFSGTFIFEGLDLTRNFLTNRSGLAIFHRYKFLAITRILFSTKTQKEVFEPAMAEWNFEIYEALKDQEGSRLLIINLRNVYGFLITIWMKSPIGDLIEFVRKLAK
ncbi:MAG: hypothetical protein M3T96_06500 [Acidobacteriota bacterium]|nr:hypothetical protein [Acidobacteriota bacterium]